MRYEVLFDAQRIRQLLIQFASDPVGVVIDQATALQAQLISEGDEWVLRPLQSAFTGWSEGAACGTLLTLTQGEQQLQMTCQSVSRDEQLLHLGFPDCVRHAQLRKENRVSLEQVTGVSLTCIPSHRYRSLRSRWIYPWAPLGRCCRLQRHGGPANTRAR